MRVYLFNFLYGVLCQHENMDLGGSALGVLMAAYDTYSISKFNDHDFKRVLK